MATTDHLERAAALAGCAVWERDIAIDGFYRRSHIVLRRGLRGVPRRVVLAHELGHHVLGHDAGAFDRAEGHVPRSRAEAAAHLFAYALLMGRPCLTQAGLDRQITLAAAAGLPLDFVFTAASIITRTPLDQLALLA